MLDAQKKVNVERDNCLIISSSIRHREEKYDTKTEQRDNDNIINHRYSIPNISFYS